MDKTRQCNSNSQAGFTLVEVLIGMVIVTVLVVGFFQLMGWNFSAAYLLREKTEAVVVAQEKIDSLTVEILKGLEALASNPASKSVLEIIAAEDGYVDNEEALFIGSGDRTVFHCAKIEHEVENEIITGYKVVVVSFYGDGNRHVQLEYFIEG